MLLAEARQRGGQLRLSAHVDDDRRRRCPAGAAGTAIVAVDSTRLDTGGAQRLFETWIRAEYCDVNHQGSAFT